MSKRLYRSKNDRMIAGVCGGIAEYFAIDPTVVRILAAASILVGTAGFFAYLVLWVVVPENPGETKVN